MADIEEAPLDRARAKRDQIERELKKCPDFQLYLLTRSLADRMRMEQLLDRNPRFRQSWWEASPRSSAVQRRQLASNVGRVEQDVGHQRPVRSCDEGGRSVRRDADEV